MARRIEVFVEKGKEMYGCTFEGSIEGCGWSGDGTSAEKAIEDLHVAEREMREYAAEQGKVIPEVEYVFRYDVGSFFSRFPYLNVSEVAKRIGISPGLMRKYASGVSVPSEKRLREIEQGLNAIADEIKDTRLWAQRGRMAV